MKYVLDTNVVSEATKERPNPNCLAWLETNIEQCAISTVTLAELSYGVERLPDGKRKRDLERKLDFLWQDFSDRILDFDENAAAEFGRYVAEIEALRGLAAVQAADPRDLLIGALAKSRGWTIVTRNHNDFPLLKAIDPFV